MFYIMNSCSISNGKYHPWQFYAEHLLYGAIIMVPLVAIGVKIVMLMIALLQFVYYQQGLGLFQTLLKVPLYSNYD